MGWFSDKRKPTSMEVGEVIDLLESDKPSDKKAREELMKKLKRGEVPIVSPKQQKEMEKLLKRTTQGERGLKALREGLRKNPGGTGNQNYKNIPLKDRVHPSMYAKLERSGKLGGKGVSFAEAAQMKTRDPAAYSKLLEAEARRQGLIK